MEGKVEVKRPGAYWAAAAAGAVLNPGDQVRTGSDGRAEVKFDDGSLLRLERRAFFTLEDGGPAESRCSLGFGRLLAWVRKSAGRRFSVRTATAVAAVRGTEFIVSVDRESMATQVDLLKGELAVGDNSGNELILREGQGVSVTREGLGAPAPVSQGLEEERRSGARALARELGLAMSKEAVLAAAAEEVKLAEYQQGKVLTDVFGNRVRVEEYIMRPAANQFKFVVLNKRQDRFDYFFYHGTFNKALPADLSIALRQLGGAPDAAPEWYLGEYRTGRSNTQDAVVERSYGGHPVDVNNNAPAADDVTRYYDSASNSFVTIAAGRPYFKTLFDYYRIWYNPANPDNPEEPSAGNPNPAGLTYRWDPAAGVVPWNGAANGVQNLEGDVTATIFGGNVNYAIESSLPDGGLLHHRVRETYGVGDDYTQWDNYIMDNNGRIASVSDFAGVTSGPSYREALLKWNFQQVITSSFFGNRKIDLVVEPKILIQSGLVR